jgi:hypothetical protein
MPVAVMAKWEHGFGPLLAPRMESGASQAFPELLTAFPIPSLTGRSGRPSSAIMPEKSGLAIFSRSLISSFGRSLRFSSSVTLRLQEVRRQLNELLYHASLID